MNQKLAKGYALAWDFCWVLALLSLKLPEDETYLMFSSDWWIYILFRAVQIVMLVVGIFAIINIVNKGITPQDCIRQAKTIIIWGIPAFIVTIIGWGLIVVAGVAAGLILTLFTGPLGPLLGVGTWFLFSAILYVGLMIGYLPALVAAFKGILKLKSSGKIGTLEMVLHMILQFIPIGNLLDCYALELRMR